MKGKWFVSSVNGNVYDREIYQVYEKTHRGKLPLPLNEYPFYIAFDEEEKQMFIDRANYKEYSGLS